MSPNPAKDQNTSVLAGTEEETVVIGSAQRRPLVAEMTVNELNQALAAQANDIKTHISDALEEKIIINPMLMMLLAYIDYIVKNIKENPEEVIAALYDLKNGI